MLQYRTGNLGHLPRVFALALLFSALPSHILAANAARPVLVNTTITNALTRYLTNVIEVTIPNNVFVDEFRTNWVRRDITNLIDLYQTNLVFHYRTNVLTVDRYATNFVTAWQTNVKTFTVTNWQSVTVTTTNIVSLPISSPAEIPQTIPAAAPVVMAVTSDAPAPKAEPLSVASGIGADRGYELELTHVGASPQSGQFPIRLALLSAGTAVSVSEWRVESTKGSGLMVSAKPEFSTVLPAGVYRVTARVRGADGTARNVRGETEVKTDARAMRTSASVATAR
jgi:hypothetical protein